MMSRILLVVLISVFSVCMGHTEVVEKHTPAVSAEEHIHYTPIDITPYEPTPAKERKVIVVEASAYTIAEDECGKSDGVTASGKVATPNYTVACDDLPFGTKILINGRVYEIQDRFGGDYTNRIDICMATKEECFAFGRRDIEIEVLE